MCTRAACKIFGCAEEDEDICVICQDKLGDPASHVKLECGHVFHGQCMVDALTRSLKCPVCRFQLGEADNDDTHGQSSDDDSVADTFITVKEAVKVAREVAKTDKATARSMKTLGSWKKRMKEARTTVKKACKKLKPFEDAMYAEMEAHEKKLDARFKARNAKLIEEIATARAMEGRAVASWRATRMRIAKKHGFVYRRWN